MKEEMLRQAEAYIVNLLNSGPVYLQQHFPDVLWFGDTEQPTVALTFDDGPHPQDTPQLLEVLARHDAKASFCWLGEQIVDHPDLVRAAVAAGHQLMIHGYRHRSFLLEENEALHTQLNLTRSRLTELTGRRAEIFRYIRPPFGHFTTGTLRDLSAWGYRTVLGSVVPTHWVQPAALTVRQVIAQAQNGMLLVLHEGQDGPNIAELTDTILTELGPSRYDYITVDQMWRQQHTDDDEIRTELAA